MTSFVEADGARLEARDIPSSGSSTTTLVFLHEGLGSVSSWRDFPQRVAEATGLRTIVYSRRGYGGGTVESVVLDACGHSPHRDQAERTLEAVAAFVRARIT